MNKILRRLCCVLPLLISISQAEPPDVARKQCRSVHMNHGPMPEQCQAIYIEAVAEKSAPGTYFSAANFNDGYIGMQELANGKHIVIFSIWDPVAHGDNPNDVPEQDRTELMKVGEGVKASRFGNEGTGGKSMGDSEWKLNEKVKFLVTLTPSKREGYKIISGYVNDNGNWRLISSWRTHRSKKELSRATSFVEDFRRNYESATIQRSAVYGPCYVMTKEGEWKLLNKGRFTADGNPATNIMAEVVPEMHAFRIATGGETKTGQFKLNQSRTLPSEAKAPASPGSDVDNIIKNPVKELP